MKRKQILARALTLGLLLSLPCGAWAETLSANVILDSDKTYTDGLTVSQGVTLTANNLNVAINGSMGNTINTTYYREWYDYFQSKHVVDYNFGLINDGEITKVKDLTADTVLNLGKMEVENLIVSINAEAGYNSMDTGSAIINAGADANLIISGSITKSSGFNNNPIANLDGATITLEGEQVSIEPAMGNDSGSTLNIKTNVTFNNSLANYNGAVINADKDVQIISGSFLNGDEGDIGGTVNAADADLILVTNSGSSGRFYNNADMSIRNIRVGDSGGKNGGTLNVYGSIVGNFENYGNLYAPSGSLTVDGTLTQNGANNIKTDVNTALDELIVTKMLTVGENYEVNDGIELEVKKIVAPEVNNYASLKADTLFISKSLNNENYKNNSLRLEVNDLIISDAQNVDIVNGENFYDHATMVVHGGIVSNDGSQGTLKNYAKLDMDGEAGYIDESITILNNGTGVITADNSLIIAGTLENDGEINAHTLYVANGRDGTPSQKEEFDGEIMETPAFPSKAFNVDNLNILDGGSFVLNNDEYELTSINVGANADLTATGTVSGVDAVALADAAEFTSASLAMSDGGVVTSDSGSLTTTAMNGEDLTFNLQSGKEKQINIKEEFTGGDLKINVTSLTPDQVVIEKMNGSGVTINGNSDITDSFDSDDIEAGLQSLAYTASINEQSGDQSRKVTSAAGKILGPTEAMTDAKNKIIKSSVKEKINPANQGISEMASIALMTWRQENNDMNKRLGELRDSAGEHGVWVRMTRGEAKYGNQNIKNQYNAYQLGYDEKLSVDKHWTVGAALTYTDAESSFSYGKGENKHKGLALYGSRLNDDGSFIDLIARYARLEHEYEVYGGAGKGDFDTNGYSLSAEYGKRFTQENGLWIEPQVELTYGKVSSGEYLTNNGVRVRQEGMDSLVGRLGFALGKNLAQGKGNVYLRASYLYDFDGETDVRYSYDRQNKRFEQDLSGGWWEVGVGTNINLSEASHLYFDVEKTYGGDVATPWQWNAGVRWSF